MMKDSGALLLLLLCSSVLAFAQQYKTLYSFAGANVSDGAEPHGNLIIDHAGNLYGTTRVGGAVNAGSVFELSPSGSAWSETVLYSFCSNIQNFRCADGSIPTAGVLIDSKGNLYGTTSAGGMSNCPDSFGCGTVFELSPPSAPGGAWREMVLYNFCENFSNNICEDGTTPTSALTMDSLGNLYGTTTAGGVGNQGTVFELSPGSQGWTEVLLHSFCVGGQGFTCPDGERPAAGVVFGKDGNLYGTTRDGGSNQPYAEGTVYKLSPGSNGWTETVLFVFYSPGTKGAEPLGTVSFDRAGNLYSTASTGGTSYTGSVFRLSPKGTSATFLFNGIDGSNPVAGVLVDPNYGSVYGTTSGGNTNNEGNVFKIGPKGNETVLYTFCRQANCTDGAGPQGGLAADRSRNLYGTTGGGGTNGFGVVFEITP